MKYIKGGNALSKNRALFYNNFKEETFFRSVKEVAMAREDNENPKTGSAKTEAIKAREKAMEESYCHYMSLFIVIDKGQ